MKKKLTKFRPKVLSKNHTAEPLRLKNKLFPVRPYRSVVRLGSVTEIEDEDRRIVCNSAQAGRKSSNKLVMKKCFEQFNLPQARMYQPSEIKTLILENSLKDHLPLIAKKIMGKKGIGMQVIVSTDAMNEFIENNSLKEYFFEKFYNYGREYRIHTSIASPSFMIWRKLRRNDSEEKWYFNNDNCNWVSPEHELFDAPPNLDEIVKNCQQALISVGLDIGACDVRIQTSKHNPPSYIICEVNSGPSLGEKGVLVYRDEIIKILDLKYSEKNGKH